MWIEAGLIAGITLVFFVLIWCCINEYSIYKLKKKLGIKQNGLGSLDEMFLQWNKGKINFKRLELKIKQAGSPFGMTVAKYWLGKVILLFVAAGYSWFTTMDQISAVIIVVTAFFFPNILLISKRRDRLVAFRQELPEVIDIIELGVTADVSLNDTFLLAADTVEGSDLKKELLFFAANYFVTRDKEECLRTFTDNIGVPEAKILSMALLQGEKTGKMRDIIASISSGMFNTALAKVNRDEKTVQYKVLFALFVLMATSILIYFQPYLFNLQSGLQNIF